MRMPEENAVKKLTLLRGWKRRALDRDRWKEVLTAARAENGL